MSAIEAGRCPPGTTRFTTAQGVGLGLRGEPGDRGIKLRPSKGAGVPGGQGGEVWGANGLDDALPRLEPAASAQLLAEQHRDLVTDAEPSSFDVVERHGLSLCR